MTSTALERPSRTGVVASDAVRALGVVSIVVAGVQFGSVEVALFALVLLGLVIPRFLRLPSGLDIANGLTLLAAGWFAVVDLYARVGWLDIAAHTVANGVLAVMGVVLLGRLWPEHAELRDARARTVVVIVTVAAGALLGVLWEFGEWAGHTLVDGSINVGYDDTLGDLAAGMCGSLAGGLALARRR
jgi:hypothetical protein